MEGHTQGHIKRNNETFYFVCPKSAIFVPDTQKYPSSRLIHLRYVTKNSLKIKGVTKTVSELVSENPEIKEVLAEAGFKEIIKPMSLAVMGKVMTIPNGAAIKNIPMDKVFETFEKHGFEVKTETS